MTKDKAIRSAYEIAMEKLRRQDLQRGEQAAVPLTEDQKRRIAEIRSKHEARLAEREILLRSEKAKALASGDPEQIDKVEKEHARDRERIESQREREIAAVHAEPSAGGSGGAGSRESGAGAGGKRSRKAKVPGKPTAVVVLGLALLSGASAARAAAPSASAAAARPRAIALKAARLLDGTEAPERRDVLVVVEEDRIRSVGPAGSIPIPEGAEVIDLGGATLLPGLIDAHTHVLLQGDATEREYDDQILKESIPHRTIRAVAAARAALERGFTTIRDLGTEGAGYADVALRDAIAAGTIPGPRMFVATLALSVSGAYPPQGYALGSPVPSGVQVVDGPDAGRRAVREQVKYGADWIKVYCDHDYFLDKEGRLDGVPTFEPAELRAIVDEAHRQGKRVAAHAMTPKGIGRALDAGVESIEHGTALDAESIRRMVAQGVFYCPTLTVMQNPVPDPTQEGGGIWMRVPELQKRSFEAALKAGVRIAFGTDAGGFPWSVNEAEELDWMVKYGMSPAQALRAATSVAADLLGRGAELGRVAPGYRADLVAVPGDPLDDIGLMKKVDFVMAAGKVMKGGSRPRL